MSGIASVIGGAAVAGASSLGNTVLNAGLNYGLQKDAQQYNSLMANSAYQRAVTDMENAGLNPALLMGNGSASPATASSGVGHINTDSGFSSALGSILNFVSSDKRVASLIANEAGRNERANVSNALKEHFLANQEKQFKIKNALSEKELALAIQKFDKSVEDHKISSALEKKYFDLAVDKRFDDMERKFYQNMETARRMNEHDVQRYYEYQDKYKKYKKV